MRDFSIYEEWLITHEPECMTAMVILCIVIAACMIFGATK